MTTPTRIREFGDFQTPRVLAAEVCAFLRARGVTPAAVVEPTCGSGNFLLAALDGFPAATCLGNEINPTHVEILTSLLRARGDRARCRLTGDSFFQVDWRTVLAHLPEPVLVLGNPPWVTNSDLGALGSANVPAKSNQPGYSGLDAMTGKSNFDISEWMLLRLLEALAARRGWLAMLVKTAVARKALAHAWRTGLALDWAEMRIIDTQPHFGAAVDSCLLVLACGGGGRSRDCPVYADLRSKESVAVLGWRDGQLVANVPAYERGRRLTGDGPHQWRSGVKHDCAKVMELTAVGGRHRNGLGEVVELEGDYLYPLLKSSDVANGRPHAGRWLLVPQRSVGHDTAEIRRHAPKTWAYLERHGTALDRRGSRIYRNRPRFSVFGVGEYTFAPWKVAISGFYKRLAFAVVGPTDGRPTVFDDTVYFVACTSEAEARSVASLLNGEIAKDFFSAYVFWDAKRPITVELLRRLDLRALARGAP